MKELSRVRQYCKKIKKVDVPPFPGRSPWPPTRSSKLKSLISTEPAKRVYASPVLRKPCFVRQWLTPKSLDAESQRAQKDSSACISTASLPQSTRPSAVIVAKRMRASVEMVFKDPLVAILAASSQGGGWSRMNLVRKYLIHLRFPTSLLVAGTEAALVGLLTEFCTLWTPC